MQVKILRALVLPDGRAPLVGDEIQVTQEIGNSLIQAHLAEPVIENALSKKKKEVRKK
jgi:hypothetical protein